MATAEIGARRRYTVLGPVEARLDGRVLPVAPGKQTLLLAALLARPDRVVPVDTLIDTLWGDGPSPGAAGTLRAVASKLRRALAAEHPAHDPRAEGLLVCAAGGYRLCISTSAARDRAPELLDAWDFASLLAQARAARLAGRTAAAVDAYRAALGLWRGAAFAGATGHDPVGALVRGEGRRLDIERAEAMEECLAAELDLGRHAELLGELDALVSAEPLHERPSELLMVALYRTGRQQDALGVYRQLRRLLADELGIDPSAQVRSLHKRILHQDPTLIATVPQTGRRTLGVVPAPVWAPSQAGTIGATRSAMEAVGTGPADLVSAGNLPGELGGLVGREATLAEILQSMRESRVVTLTGTAGVGKTCLAMHAARRAVQLSSGAAGDAAAPFADGAWLVQLAPVADGQTVVDAVSGALAKQHHQGHGGLERLVEHLRSRRLLLLLDNCEHVIDAAAELVAEIVHRCPHIVVLATSREPLGVDGEIIRLVPPLAVPPASSVDVGTVRLAAAVVLFLARAHAAAPGFALTDSNAAAVGELCRRLDGVPLAIELAATRMRSLSPVDVVERLEQRFSLLSRGPRTAGMRHRTLQAAIDWSYELLDDGERRVFDRLSVFAGGFVLQAAERIATDSDPRAGRRGQRTPIDETPVVTILAGLVDKSMVVAQHEGGSTRYTLLETLRAYGRQRLAARGEEHATQRAHATYFAAFVEDADRRLGGPESRRFAQSITQELDDVRAAHAWALAHDLGLAVRLVAGLFRFVEHQLPPEVPTWAEHTIQVAENTSSGHHLLPTVYAVAARGATRRGDLHRARSLAERGADAGVGPGDPARRHPLYALGVVALFESRLEAAGRLTEEVEQLSLVADDPWFAVRARVIRSLAHVYAGDVAAALAVAHEARTLADGSGDPGAIGWSRYVTGEALLETDPDRAVVLLEEALAAAREIDERYLTGVAMVSATSLRGRHGDPREAAALFRDVVGQWHIAGNWTQQWTTVRNIVELLVRTGRHVSAAVLLGALDGSGTAPPAFGAGAARLAAARRALLERLGPDAFALETARGEAMDDDQALRFTDGALTHVERSTPVPR